jgi:hypothetical protein
MSDISGTDALKELTDEETKSWGVVVQADSSGKWSGNQLRFTTEEEAQHYGRDLYSRWTLVTAWKTIRTTDDVCTRWDPTQGAVFIEKKP